MSDFIDVTGKKAARPVSSWALEESSEDEQDNYPSEEEVVEESSSEVSSVLSCPVRPFLVFAQLINSVKHIVRGR